MITITLPKVIGFNDYHEIDLFKDFLNIIRDKGQLYIKGVEIAYDPNSGEHLGLFYTGKKPTHVGIKLCTKIWLVETKRSLHYDEIEYIWVKI